MNGLPRPCEPPDHTGRAATTRPLQHPSSGPDSPSNRQTHSARLPDSYLTDPGLDPRHHCPSIFEPAIPLLCSSLISCSSASPPSSSLKLSFRVFGYAKKKWSNEKETVFVSRCVMVYTHRAWLAARKLQRA